MDYIRLMKEDALGLKIDVKLPEGTRAFNFGAAPDLQGFSVVRAATAFDGANGFSSNKGELKECGKRWPDPLAGNGIYSPSGRPFTFETALPDGDYLVWLIAGPVIRTDIPSPKYLLKVGDKILFEDQPDAATLHGEKYIFRFMQTIYSQRPHALWQDFIGRMYPVHQVAVKVTGGKLTVAACNFELCAMAILPAAQKSAFDAMTRALEQERLRVFTASLPTSQPKPVTKGAGDGDLVAFIPADTAVVLPQTGPSAAERQVKEYDLAAAAGQNLIFRVAITAFADGQTITVTPPTLSGPGTIPASATRVLFQNFRQRGIDAVECGLLPTDTVPLESGVTRCFWMWMQVPKDAKPGAFAGNVVLSAGTSKITFPVKLQIYPFTLEDNLPYAFGMWYGMNKPADESQTRRVIKEQLTFMREIGFTGVDASGPDANGHMDTYLIDLARESGLGRNPRQMSMTSTLGMGRALAKTRLGLGEQEDRQPGCEFDHPEFHGMFLESARKFGAFQKQCPLPLAVQSVDEPREKSLNSWNRNYDDTCVYADLLRAGGIKTMINPMYDITHGKDYTGFIDHLDVYSSHAWNNSERSFHLAKEKGKTIWLYNSGMDRYTWGFYNWRFQSQGRMEWAFCEAQDSSEFGYAGQDWYNPFSGMGGYAPSAPYTTCKGGHLFQSCYYEVSMGITDYAYIYTLTEALKKAGPDKTATVTSATAFLAAIEKEMPEFAKIKGLASGAQVGMGSTDEARNRVGEWRAKIAGFLKELNR